MTASPARRPLRVAAAVELVSLVVLLANLATVHLSGVASLAGPVHGCAYLFVIGAVVRDPRRTGRTAWLAVVPGVGGVLALRVLGARDEPVMAA